MQQNNKAAFDYLNTEFMLLNSQIQEIRIFQDNELLNISLVVKDNNHIVEVLFEETLEYSFYYNNAYIFYNIEDYKFLYLNDEDEFYISFDPYLGVQAPHEKDGDVIRAKTLRIVVR